MNRFLLAPDSFKGSMSANEICGIMEAAIRKHKPSAIIRSMPIADGGEGTVDSFLACMSGTRVKAEVTGPHFERIRAEYAIIDHGSTAIIELASAAGLPLAGANNNPATATTFGVGELMCDAVFRGCHKIILGLGGSATTDAGTGLASALGVRFFKKDGTEFVPVGETLSDIGRIDIDAARNKFSGIDITAMYDVENTLYGKNGAAHVFSRQKGADDKMIEMLDAGLEYFSKVVASEIGVKVSNLAGGAAAGGVGAGVHAFAGAKLKRGIDTILDVVGFEIAAASMDLVITGEGRLDSQSLGGKAVMGVANRAKKVNVPVAVIAGDLADAIDPIYDEGATFILSTNRVAQDFSISRYRAKKDLALTMDTLMRILAVAGQ